MLIDDNKKHYVIGGAGIFDTVSGVFKKLFVSNAARQIALTALSAGKDAAKEIGKKLLMSVILWLSTPGND